MSKLYYKAAEILGLESNESYFTYTTNDNSYGYSYDEPATPIVLSHLICEKEGWIWFWRNDLSGLRLYTKRGHGEFIEEVVDFPETPDAIIRAFVEKYGKKKELPELKRPFGSVRIKAMNKHEQKTRGVPHELVPIMERMDIFLQHIKSLSERMDKFESRSK